MALHVVPLTCIPTLSQRMGLCIIVNSNWIFNIAWGIGKCTSLSSCGRDYLCGSLFPLCGPTVLGTVCLCRTVWLLFEFSVIFAQSVDMCILCGSGSLARPQDQSKGIFVIFWTCPSFSDCTCLATYYLYSLWSKIDISMLMNHIDKYVFVHQSIIVRIYPTCL